MVTTVTLNPALDWEVRADSLEVGKVNRFEGGELRAGGKGLNVSLLLTALGVENTAAGLAAGFTGKELIRLTEEAGCRTDFILLESGATRINIKVRAEEGEETDLNGAGPEVPLGALDGLMEKLAQAEPGGGLVLSGSLPPNFPKDSYGRILKYVREKELLTVVDAAGEALTGALPERPFLIKPNLEELSEACGFAVGDLPTAVECARMLQRQGARNVVVSMGARGALLVTEEGDALFCQSPRGKAISTVGAGDSLVAGFLYGWQLHGTLAGALRWGVSAGAATAFSSGIAGREKVMEMFPLVGNVHRL